MLAFQSLRILSKNYYYNTLYAYENVFEGTITISRSLAKSILWHLMTTINKTYTELQHPLTIVAELKTILLYCLHSVFYVLIATVHYLQISKYTCDSLPPRKAQRQTTEAKLKPHFYSTIWGTLKGLSSRHIL